MYMALCVGAVTNTRILLLAQWIVWVAQLLEHQRVDLGLNPGSGKNFSLKLLIYDLPDGYSESKIFNLTIIICHVLGLLCLCRISLGR